MEEEIRRMIDRSGAEAVSVSFCDVPSGRQVHIQPDLPYHPASTIKVCVMMEVFRQADQGRLVLDGPILVRNTFSSIVDASPYFVDPAEDSDPELYTHIGRSLPIRNLVERMVARSSNLATNILLERVSAERVSKFMHELGAEEVVVRRGVEDRRAYALGLNNSATSRDLMYLMFLLAQGKVVSAPASKSMVEILSGQVFNEGIPALLPPGTTVAHKTGWIDRNYHDAAIVYPRDQGAYVLVVMTKGLAELTEGPELVSKISRVVYDETVARRSP